MTTKRTPDPTPGPPEGLPAQPLGGHVPPSELPQAEVGQFYGSGGKAAAPDSDEERAAEERAAHATTRAHTDPYPDEDDPHPGE